VRELIEEMIRSELDAVFRAHAMDGEPSLRMAATLRRLLRAIGMGAGCAR